jgi:hypothetical protein
VVETEEGGLWVVKFRGAGQGARALVAEVLVGALARALGLPVPKLAVVEVPESLGRTERDPEIQDLLRASRGANLGVAYLEGAFNFDPRAAADLVSPEMAADLVWFDALTTNPDRSPRNPNLMVHAGRPWLIDHGAALYPHFAWDRVTPEQAAAPFARIAEHVLLGLAGPILPEDEARAERLLGGVPTAGGADSVAAGGDSGGDGGPGVTAASGLEAALAAIPDDFLEDPLLAGEFPDVAAHRDRYRRFLTARLAPDSEGFRPFARGAEEARLAHRASRPRKLEARR